MVAVQNSKKPLFASLVIFFCRGSEIIRSPPFGGELMIHHGGDLIAKNLPPAGLFYFSSRF
jgi:hypothetical protein